MMDGGKLKSRGRTGGQGWFQVIICNHFSVLMGRRKRYVHLVQEGGLTFWHARNVGSGRMFFEFKGIASDVDTLRK